MNEDMALPASQDRAASPSGLSPASGSSQSGIPSAAREAELVLAVGLALSNLGSEQGYFPSVGAPISRRLIAAYRAYGMEPEFGRAFKW